jgi:hypothetical protein
VKEVVTTGSGMVVGWLGATALVVGFVLVLAAIDAWVIRYRKGRDR